MWDAEIIGVVPRHPIVTPDVINTHISDVTPFEYWEDGVGNQYIHTKKSLMLQQLASKTSVTSIEIYI